MLQLSTKERELLAALGLLLIGAALLVVFFAVGDEYLGGYALDLGHIATPSLGYTYFTAFWLVLGLPATVLLALGVARFADSDTLRTRLSDRRRLSDPAFAAFAVVTAVLSSVAVRWLVLGPAPLTDDEGAYEFMARLLASGRLYRSSPALKEHFDTYFMINDGRYYAQYFLGWPALMVPALWVGLHKYANALYSGVAVLGIFLVLRRLAGSDWAKLGTLFYLGSLLHIVGAATQLSHTSCLATLVWLAWAVLRARDEDASARLALLVATLFCVAFFIRPMTALAGGLPLLAYWILGLRRQSPGVRRRAWLMATTVIVGFAALFLAGNTLQHGSAFRTGYQAYYDFARSKGFEGSVYLPGADGTVAGLQFRVQSVFARLGVNLYRVNVGLFGWPSCLLPALLAVRARGAGLWWAASLWFFLVLVFQSGAGIDTFGPIKFTEISLPIIALIILGLRHATEVIARLPASRTLLSAKLPFVLGGMFVFTNLIGYWPVRFAALKQMVDVINAPRSALHEAGVRRALVFTTGHFTPPCSWEPARHFVEKRPYNDPDLQNPILWVRHVSFESDRALVERLDRPGYMLLWPDCQPRLVPIDEAEAIMQRSGGGPRSGVKKGAVLHAAEPHR